MSNSVYPTLPGLEFPVHRTVVPPPVTPFPTPSRREYRGRSATLPLYRYQLSYEFLRGDAVAAEWQTLEGFYKLMGGDFDTFLFADPDDSTVAAMTFGTGNGSTTAFQLVRTLGGFAEAIFDLNGAPQIFKAGVLQTLTTHYTISATGLVTFVTAPTAGQALTWTGSFYRRCKFSRSELEFKKFMRDFWDAKKVEIEMVLA